MRFQIFLTNNLKCSNHNWNTNRYHESGSEWTWQSWQRRNIQHVSGSNSESYPELPFYVKLSYPSANDSEGIFSTPPMRWPFTFSSIIGELFAVKLKIRRRLKPIFPAEGYSGYLQSFVSFWYKAECMGHSVRHKLICNNLQFKIAHHYTNQSTLVDTIVIYKAFSLDVARGCIN